MKKKIIILMLIVFSLGTTKVSAYTYFSNDYLRSYHDSYIHKGYATYGTYYQETPWGCERKTVSSKWRAGVPHYDYLREYLRPNQCQ